MGSLSRSILIAACVGLNTGFLSFAADLHDLDLVRNQISEAEAEVLASATRGDKGPIQTKKIRRLLTLQRKEISLTSERIDHLTKNLASLSERKKDLETQSIAAKQKLRKNIRLMQSFVEGAGDLEGKNNPALDALWISTLNLENERKYYLLKALKRNLAEDQRLRADAEAVAQLEARIIKEKAELEYYAQELKEKNNHLQANERLQKEVTHPLAQNRVSQLAQLKSLKDSEHDLKKMLKTMDSDKRLADLKGQLPFPVNGPIVSNYGRNYDAKTSLLTFQKGISIGAFAGSEVKSVAAGKVAYAGALKNYGLMVIIEHSGQFYTLYGHLGATEVKEGDTIGFRQTLGKTSEAGTPLYFELRDRNIAINPLQWLQNASVTLNQ